MILSCFYLQTKDDTVLEANGIKYFSRSAPQQLIFHLFPYYPLFIVIKISGYLLCGTTLLQHMEKVFVMAWGHSETSTQAMLFAARNVNFDGKAIVQMENLTFGKL